MCESTLVCVKDISSALVRRRTCGTLQLLIVVARQLASAHEFQLRRCVVDCAARCVCGALQIQRKSHVASRARSIELRKHSRQLEGRLLRQHLADQHSDSLQ
uniref:Uncharacterized protein n=1 Tax=Coccolithus braarudii TaxID=221442 RepID=A0A7S0Q807_9EUKA